MISDQVKAVAMRIGAFYLGKNKGDYAAAGKEVTDLMISSLEVAEGKVPLLNWLIPHPPEDYE